VNDTTLPNTLHVKIDRYNVVHPRTTQLIINI
jgi:hypothetical protein